MGLPLQTMTLEAFLAWENEQPDRHEYWRCEVIAMTDRRRVQGCVVANLLRHLGNHLEGSPCQVFSQSMKVQVGADTVLYPDVFVTCDAADLRTEQVFSAPILVIDVLSSSQAHDRGQKFAFYRRLESMREYVLIDPDTQRVEVFRLGSDGLWDLHGMSDNEALVLSSIHCTLALSDLFSGVVKDTPA